MVSTCNPLIIKHFSKGTLKVYSNLNRQKPCNLFLFFKGEDIYSCLTERIAKTFSHEKAPKKINFKIQRNWASKGEISPCFISPLLSSDSLELQNLFSTMISFGKIFITVRITSVGSFCPFVT